ncbi:MAG: phage integrase SAM-like domain-containing protein, partial [Candidatus Pacearchaeota archaeon]|nr:phage integrase SAM-like domain-containing protein [Candidatus Pacearchaeota archaeon]
MSDIRKRTGKKGTTYQVRYPSTATKTGYAYKTFDTMKEARAFREDAKARQSFISESNANLLVSEAIDKWLKICEKIGRHGRERVEPETLKQYEGLAKHINEYKWQKPVENIDPSDVVHFRNWLIENKSRDLAKKTLSAFHSVLIEMKHQGYINTDPASGISVKTSGRLEVYENEKAIPSDNEVKIMLGIIDELATRDDSLGISWRRYKPMIYLALFSGMRPSEYRGLSWEDVYGDR